MKRHDEGDNYLDAHRRNTVLPISREEHILNELTSPEVSEQLVNNLTVRAIGTRRAPTSSPKIVSIVRRNINCCNKNGFSSGHRHGAWLIG